MVTAARWISVLLHPLFMPLFTLALVFRVDPHLAYFLPDQVRYIILAMVTVMTIAFPMVSTLLLLRARMLTSLEMPTRQERVAPFLMTLLYYGMTYYLLQRSPLHPAVLSIFVGIIIAMLLTLLFNMKWKVSIHMVGIGGVVGSLAALATIHSLPLLPVIAITLVLAGLLGTARLIAGAHRPAHIYSGMAIGMAATYFSVVFGVAV